MPHGDEGMEATIGFEDIETGLHEWTRQLYGISLRGEYPGAWCPLNAEPEQRHTIATAAAQGERGWWDTGGEGGGA